MSNQQQEQQSNDKNTFPRVESQQDYQELVREVADRIWKKWREELRREQERHSARQRR